jgi:hypothetical protein
MAAYLPRLTPNPLFRMVEVTIFGHMTNGRVIGRAVSDRRVGLLRPVNCWWDLVRSLKKTKVGNGRIVPRLSFAG